LDHIIPLFYLMPPIHRKILYEFHYALDLYMKNSYLLHVILKPIHFHLTHFVHFFLSSNTILLNHNIPPNVLFEFRNKIFPLSIKFP
jgi:hypothetical protein